MNLAIVPARGGSKRIPGKNKREFLGRPILSYPLEALKSSQIFDTVMVSTEDREIGELATSLGAEVPFSRSEENASDFASTASVIVEVLENYASLGQEFEYACCCYPTAPLLRPSRLTEAFDLLSSGKHRVVIPVARFSTTIWRALKIEDNTLEFFWPENEFKRSQDLEPGYYDSGQFYFFHVETFLKTRSFFGNQTAGIVLPGTEVQDIDTEEDWKLAEFKYQWLNSSLNNRTRRTRNAT